MQHNEAQNRITIIIGHGQHLKSSVFSLRLRDGNDGADVTSTGKVFHTFATQLEKLDR